MPRAFSLASVLALLCSSCGGVDNDPASSGDSSSGSSPLQCEALEPAQASTCDLVAPEATMLAHISPSNEGGNGFQLASDGTFLYFVSESRVFRLPVGGGEPEALTPAGSADGSFRLDEGWLYWTKDRMVSRMSAAGGDIEPLVQLPEEGGWAVVPDAILWWTYYDEGEPLHRYRISTAETSILFESPAPQGIRGATANEQWLYIALTEQLVRIPLEGGDTEVVAGEQGQLGTTPRVDHEQLGFTSEHVYFAGRGPLHPDDPLDFEQRVFRVTKAAPHTVDVALTGFTARTALHDGILFADMVIPAGLEETRGAIVRVSPDGTPEHIADSDLTTGTVTKWSSDGLVASDCWVYFNLLCRDDFSYRLVAMPNPGSVR